MTTSVAREQLTLFHASLYREIFINTVADHCSLLLPVVAFTNKGSVAGSASMTFTQIGGVRGNKLTYPVG